jgi:hypothetical protein
VGGRQREAVSLQTNFIACRHIKGLQLYRGSWGLVVARNVRVPGRKQTTVDEGVYSTYVNDDNSNSNIVSSSDLCFVYLVA